MNKSLKFVAAMALASAFVGCDTDTQFIGTSIIPESDQIVMSTSEFNIDTESRVMGSVFSRSPYGYIGRVTDPETGTSVTTNFADVFTVGANRFYDYDKIPQSDFTLPDGTTQRSISAIGTVSLPMFRFYGDSLNVMKVKMMELKKTLPEDVNLRSDFDPEAEGYVRTPEEGGLSIEKSFSIVDLNVEDSIRLLGTYAHPIRFTMPQTPYTALPECGGKTYRNYPTYVLSRYYEDSSVFETQYRFAHHVSPGFYFKVTSGSGTQAELYNAIFDISHEVTDTTAWRLIKFSSTEESKKHTNVKFNTEQMKKLASDPNCTYVKSPAGIITVARLPIDDIVRGHERDSINGASVSFLRVNNEVQDEYALPVPTTLMMLSAEQDAIDDFFDKRSLYNNRTSYVSTYSSSSNSYVFSNIATLITHLYNRKVEGMKADPTWLTKHPDWNCVALIPVTLTKDGTNAVSKVSNQLTLSSTKLARNTAKTPIYLKVTYGSYK